MRLFPTWRRQLDDFWKRARIAGLTARRAGVRRSAARVRRVFLLRAVYPHFAARLYPRRTLDLARPNRIRTVPERIRIGARENDRWDSRVSLLNALPFALKPPMNWDANPSGHALWAFRLHEWEWAYPLIVRAADDAAARDELAELVQDYCDDVTVGHPVAYEPYPLSRRLVVWTTALRVLCANHLYAFPARVASEADRGARMLADNLERDLDNNHVIANAKALAFAGTILDQPYARQGYELLWQQLRLQVRADGGHVENSTSYHFLVWRDAIEACALAREFAVPIPDDIPPRLAAMERFLAALQHPDGAFPLLNDSVNEGLALFSRFVSTGNASEEKAALSLFPDSGYAVLRQGESRVVFDAGALGPEHCPGHGHADTLGFEFWSHGHVRIVDPGTYQYEAGTWRDYFRGTAGHNTLQVDGLDSTEVMGSFRVGRMANARLIVERADPRFCVRGEHDGYARLREPVWHARTIELQNAQTLLLRDEIRGRGSHEFALHFHLAPNCCAQIEGRRARCAFGDGMTLTVESDAPGLIEISEGWYSPTWYTKFPAPVLAFKWRSEPPCQVQTVIRIQSSR